MSSSRIRTGLLAAGAALAITALAGCSGDAPATPATDDPAGEPAIVATDSLGFEIALAGPVERAVVINSYNNELLRALGVDDRVVGLDQSSINRLGYIGFDPASTVTQEATSDLNYEKIISLSPEVVILPSVSPYEEAKSQLERFGIQVAVISGFDNGALEANIDFLGTIFDEPEATATLQEFRQSLVDAVAAGAAQAEPKVIFFEDDPLNTPFFTFGPGTGYDYSIVNSGNINLAGDLAATTTGVQVDPAAVITADPAVVYSEVGVTYEPSPASDYAAVAELFTARAGWTDLAAVKTGSVYLTGYPTSTFAKAIGSLFLAKWANPEAYEDLDPVEYLDRWVTEFQGAEARPISDYILQVTW